MSTRLHFIVPRDLILNANQRMHWAPRSKRTAALRLMGRTEAQGKRLGASRAVLGINLGYPDKRQRDAENYAPTVKALVDGAVTDSGLLPADHDLHIVARNWTSDVAGIKGCFVIDLTFEPVREDA